ENVLPAHAPFLQRPALAWLFPRLRQARSAVGGWGGGIRGLGAAAVLVLLLPVFAFCAEDVVGHTRYSIRFFELLTCRFLGTFRRSPETSSWLVPLPTFLVRPALSLFVVPPRTPALYEVFPRCLRSVPRMLRRCIPVRSLQAAQPD